MSSSPNGDRRRPVTLPLWASIAAIAVATLAVTVLLYVLFRQTTGPGEVVKQIYAAARAGDCPDIEASLSPDLRRAVADACKGLVEGEIPNVEVDSVTLLGDGAESAEVVIREDGQIVTGWQLSREDEAWIVVHLPCEGVLGALGRALGPSTGGCPTR